MRELHGIKEGDRVECVTKDSANTGCKGTVTFIVEEWAYPYEVTWDKGSWYSRTTENFTSIRKVVEIA